MDKALEAVENWAREGKDQRLPSWEELPSIPLYMDQVISYLKETLAFFQPHEDCPPLTSSMINNYVKCGVLPHPEKKKYSREHLAALTVICMLKPVLSLQDIKILFDGQELSPRLYQLFLDSHSPGVEHVFEKLEENCENGRNMREQALRLAVEANVKQAAAQRILGELEQKQPSKERRKSKQK